MQLPCLLISSNISFFYSLVIFEICEGLVTSYCTRLVHLSNHLLPYVSAVMRGCLVRKKYKYLQEERESKVSHNKVKGDARKIISQARICHVSFMSKVFSIFIFSHLPRPKLHTAFIKYWMSSMPVHNFVDYII